MKIFFKQLFFLYLDITKYFMGCGDGTETAYDLCIFLLYGSETVLIVWIAEAVRIEVIKCFFEKLFKKKCRYIK